MYLMHCLILGPLGYNLFFEELFVLANSVGPYEISHLGVTTTRGSGWRITGLLFIIKRINSKT